jgi:hypothetical protein
VAANGEVQPGGPAVDDRRVTPRALGCAALLLTVGAGCAGGSTPAPRSAVALTALETRAGLTGCSPSTEPLTVAVDTCTDGSDSVTLGTFDTSGHRDLWVLAQRSVGGGVVISGPLWAAMTLDVQNAATLAAALGGTVR